MKWLLALAIALAMATAQAAQFGPAQYKIVSDHGDQITNFDLRPELAKRLSELAGQVPVGNAQGDVTLYQLYDLNCPFCREAAADVDAIVVCNAWRPGWPRITTLPIT